MTRQIYFLLIFVLAASTLFACGLPTTNINVGGERPTLAVIGAPAASVLVIDGKSVGDASLFDGTHQTLTLEEGFHEVTIMKDGTVFYFEKIFVSTGETKRIELQVPKFSRE